MIEITGKFVPNGMRIAVLLILAGAQAATAVAVRGTHMSKTEKGKRTMLWAKG
jgi:hypothetical protein